MKNVKRGLIFCAALAAVGLLAAIAAWAMQRPMPDSQKTSVQQRFYVRGQVRGIDPNERSIRIKHEEIPNYMAAMTMPFQVRDTSMLRGLKNGDEVGFELVVTKDDSWVAEIHKLSELATGVGSSALLAKDDRVQIGETVPDFTLIDQDGRVVSLTQFRGKALLLTFIYTRCPLPNFCPLMSKNFASLQQRLAKQFSGKFHLLSVSIDPQFDRPEILKAYAARYTDDDRTWTFATGTAEQTDAIGALFGLVQERAGGLINHDLRTALIGPDGRLVHVWKSNMWTPFEVQRRVEETLKPAQ